MFGRVLRCNTMYTFPGALAPWQNFARFKIHFTSKSCVLVYCQRYCTELQQRASAKLYGVVQGMELPNFRRGRHLYSAGPSRWASAHILVFYIVLIPSTKIRYSTVEGMVEVGTGESGWSGAQPDGRLIFPCTVKSRSSLLAPAHPGGPGKMAVKWLRCGGAVH